MSGLSQFRRSILSGQTAAFSDCFADIGSEGKSTPMPPRSAKCTLAPDNRCRVVEPGAIEHPWDYVLPTDDPVWSRFELRPEEWHNGHAFYKTIHWKQEDGICTLDIHARADFNDDGVFGLYTIGEQFPVGATSIDQFTLFPMAWDPEEPGRSPTRERPLLPD